VNQLFMVANVCAYEIQLMIHCANFTILHTPCVLFQVFTHLEKRAVSLASQDLFITSFFMPDANRSL